MSVHSTVEIAVSATKIFEGIMSVTYLAMKIWFV